MLQSDLFVDDFNYHLPLNLIAQEPSPRRDSCRLLLLEKSSGKINHYKFSDLKSFLKKGDVLVLNESKVFPARLIGHKKNSGGEVEIFLHHQIENFSESKNNNVWEALVRGRIKPGLKIVFAFGLEAEILQKNDELCLVSFNSPSDKFFTWLDKIGQLPLPPYIKRKNGVKREDKKDYQTVFASDDKIGSVAAPTAGLHFTKKLLQELENNGIEIIKLSLHVGLGTFAPVKVDNILDHKMHAEFVSLKRIEAEKIIKAKKEGRRIVAVGTTSCRALESWAMGFAFYKPLQEKNKSDVISFWTNIFIYPGYKFLLTDALITNFHLPKSTLLMLVSALAGKNNIDKGYEIAIKEKYRFFSYGDAMFIY
jgi:S-adenosylmethionine:tRNA ribosyltransferase-isomerase